MINKNLIKVLLTILGAVLFLTFIWYRFIRERLPKDIPFHLTEYGCIILMYICSIYLFVIIMLIVTFETKNDKLSLIIDYIYKPLKVLDESFKGNTLITYYHEIFIEVLSKMSLSYSKVYYLFNIVPRLVLVMVLSLDTFYFHRLEYLYKIILIGLLIFLYKYFIYSLKYAKELYIQKLEAITNKIQTNYNKNPNDSSDSFLYARDFIDIQTDSIFYYNHKYTAYPLPLSSYLALFRGKNAAVEQIQEEHHRLLNIIIPISVHLEEFDLRNNFNSKIKYIKIGIFSTYLLCWSYILIISLPLLPADAFQWLWMIQDIEDPFSLTNCAFTKTIRELCS
jgi:hypothetical protein